MEPERRVACARCRELCLENLRLATAQLRAVDRIRKLAIAVSALIKKIEDHTATHEDKSEFADIVTQCLGVEVEQPKQP